MRCTACDPNRSIINYDRNLKDIFGIMRDITARILKRDVPVAPEGP